MAPSARPREQRGLANSNMTIDHAWETALSALDEELTQLESLCASGSVETISQGIDSVSNNSFMAAEVMGPIPRGLVSQALELHQRMSHVQHQIEHALELAAQGVAVSHELARTYPETPPHFIDTSI